MSKVRVHIPEPCHEDFDQMTETERGRLCAKCDKEVYDFRGLDESQFQRTFSEFRQKWEKVCGRFDNSQLDSGPARKVAATDQPLLRKLVYGLFFLGGLGSCKRTSGIPIVSGAYPTRHDHLKAFDATCYTDSWRTDGVPVIREDTVRADTVDIPNVRDTSRVNFKTDSYELDPTARSILDDVVEQLQGRDDYRILVVGHTDDRGSEAYNQELSELRANAVREYLNGLIITDSRGVGYQYPIANNTSMVGRDRNRRVEVIVYWK